MYNSKKHYTAPSKATNTITVPTEHYTGLLAEIEKLKLKNKTMAEKNKSLGADLSYMRKLLSNMRQSGQEIVNFGETN